MKAGTSKKANGPLARWAKTTPEERSLVAVALVQAREAKRQREREELARLRAEEQARKDAIVNLLTE